MKIPSDAEIPEYVKEVFADFYRAMFDEVVKKEKMHAVFLEYAWDMGWCDPCAAEPLSPDELRSAGVFWLDSDAAPAPVAGVAPMPRPRIGGAQPVMLTRLHLRYTPETLPEDLMFQETQDRKRQQRGKNKGRAPPGIARQQERRGEA